MRYFDFVQSSNFSLHFRRASLAEEHAEARTLNKIEISIKN